MTGLRLQTGVALITALIFTALVTTFAVAIASQQQIDIRRTGNILSSDRAYLLALGIEDWARDVLQKDIIEADGELIDHLGEDWNIALPPIQVEGATVTGRIIDLQGRINVNALVNSSGDRVVVEVDRFKRLLELFEFDPDIVDALVDWIDPNLDTSGFAGAEDSHYLSKQPAYRVANAPMVSISELRLVEGFNNEIYRTLRPFLTALPVAAPTPPQGSPPGQPANNGATPINVNTAPLEILRVLPPQTMSESEAQSIIDAREESDRGFENVDADFLNNPIVVATNLTVANSGGLSVASEYFLIESTVVLPDAQMQLFSVVRRDNGSNGNLTVLMRGQGSY